MKKLVTLLTLVGVASAFSQGTINFNNRVSPGIVDAPITYGGAAAGVTATPPGPASGTKVNGAGTLAVGNLDFGGRFAQAALYGGPTTATEATMTLLVPAVGFRTGAAAGYVDQSSTSRTIDSVAPLGTGIFQVRAWDAGEALGANNTYEQAVLLGAGTHGAYYGKSSVLTIGPLGGGSPAAPAPNLVGLNAFAMTYSVVPEPSIIGLGVLGAAAALVVFRRRE